jgi:hypothetical protein
MRRLDIRRRMGYGSASGVPRCESLGTVLGGQEGLPVGLLAGGRTATLGQIAERHSGLKLHIDHHGRSGGAGGDDDAAFADLGDMLALATYPNVAVEISGTPSYSSRP